MRPAASFAFKLLFAAGLALQFINRELATVPMKVIADGQGIEVGRRAPFRLLLAVQFYAAFLPGALAGGGVALLLDPHVGVLPRFVSTGLVCASVACLILVAFSWKPRTLGPIAGSAAAMRIFAQAIGVQSAEALAWSFTILAGTLGIALAGGLRELGVCSRPANQ